MFRFVSFILTALLIIAPNVMFAQSTAPNMATLVADKVWIDGNKTLIAQGHVEILQGTTRIKAAKIIYSGIDGSLQIIGPITLVEGDDIVVLASSAKMDANLQNGILRSARMVLNQQLQLAAVEIHRVDGRYTQLYKTVVSSCEVCAKNRVPLWQIRARRIIHDKKERQLYFDDAVLKVLDIPIFRLPRLRLPDPSLKRATGFLVPSFKSTSKLGWGFKQPYFVRIGDHADLTFTPYLGTKTKTLELKFRKAFRKGDISFETAFSNDKILPGRERGYFFVEGRFELTRDYILRFDIESSSDRSYLLDYGYSNKDRLDSAISISRARRDKLVVTELTHYRSLRSTENSQTLPTMVSNLVYHQRFEPRFLGGDLDFRFEGHGHYRRSNLAGDAGRDLGRASLRLDWKRKWTFNNGMVASVLGQLNADYYNIRQGLAGELNDSHITPAAAVELRWPLMKTTASGATHVLEPLVHLAWGDKKAANIPDEDSRLVEFDEGNLFSLSRFPGADRYERGFRANVGLSWTRYDPKDWSAKLTMGRIFRAENLNQFQASSGIGGYKSDWLAAFQLKLHNNLSLSNRAIFDDHIGFSKNETRISWHTKRLDLGTSYIWMQAEPYENRLSDTSEWTFDAAYDFSSNWRGKTDWRYDFTAGQMAYGGIGLEYQNECVKIDLSLSRRFTSSGSLTPETNFGLKISLTGFGTNQSSAGRSRSCRTYQ